MKKRMISAARAALRRYDIELIRSSAYDRCVDTMAFVDKMKILELMPDDHLRKALDLLPKSPSQLGQDLLVLSQLGWKTGGYFVEFGATNGHSLSNSWLLENEFGWTGILAEPAQVWHSALAASGRSAHVEFDCVWDKTGEVLKFDQTDFAELSTISAFAASDSHSSGRKRRKQYEVKTISFNDLLAKYDAPAEMDFLSIDTEGSELKILKSLDFDRYRFKIIACEHNFTDNRVKILHLLNANGYVRKFERHSQFDDWYFHKESPLYGLENSSC